MGIHHNIALRRLPEDLGKFHHRKYLAADNVSQYIPGSYAWQLIFISYKNQPCAGSDGLKQRMHQKNIHHGHFINNDHIRIQRILSISVKMNSLIVMLFIRNTVQFQKPVDRLCFISGGLRHSFGRSACRRSKSKFCSLPFKKADNSINGGGLSCARTSCKNEQAIFCCFFYCFFLHFIQDSTCFLLYLGQSALYQFFILRTFNIQFIQHSGCIQLNLIIFAGINQSSLFCFF